MLKVKDFTFTKGDLVQRKFGGYQVTYKMTDAQKAAFVDFLGDEGREELEVHEYLKTNNIATVNQPSNPDQDTPDGVHNQLQSVVTSYGQAPLINEKGKDSVPTVGDARGTPEFDGTDYRAPSLNPGRTPDPDQDTSIPKDADPNG